MKIGIHGKQFGSETLQLIKDVLAILSQNSSQIVVSEHFHKILSKHKLNSDSFNVYSKGDDISSLDALITLGGDGTLLDAVTHVGNKNVPLLGINTGRLGFLATTSKENIEDSLTELFEKNYKFDERSLIELKTDDKLFNGYNFALNDFAILKKDTSSMIVVNAFIDDEFLNAYWADGLIVSTPTGSTGYSISCGGPLVLPHSENFVLTPVSPHNLTVRPIIVPDNSKLSFTIEGRSKNYLVSLDSRITTVDDSVKFNVQKADFKIKLIQLKDNNYFKTLRQKLNWGLDVRN
ncbi:NAD kinase [Fulvivirga lutimaris]|uniref:NAD kinase n=1 Tax=Fulvivirga lutimaris TaxID=1819566 RepID=UPI0012BCA39B|nr:NAD kinase [Fulvivirga lutimaris]MTI41297.1 NAD kinase [Fulvivirga lutimaris]